MYRITRLPVSSLDSHILKESSYGLLNGKLTGVAAIAVNVTRMHGIMVQIAQPVNVTIPFAELIFRDIRIHGSLTSKHLSWS